MLNPKELLFGVILISAARTAFSYRFGNGLYTQRSQPRNLNADYWVETLGLVEHSVGGQYIEVYRSTETTTDLPERFGNSSRSFGNSLYYLLKNDESYPFHVLRLDEIWQFYFGRPVTIYVIDPDTGSLEIGNIGPRENHHFVFRIPPGRIFAARLKNPRPDDYALLGLTGFPGFDVSDVSFPSRTDLLRRFPQHSEVIEELAISD